MEEPVFIDVLPDNSIFLCFARRGDDSGSINLGLADPHHAKQNVQKHS